MIREAIVNVPLAANTEKVYQLPFGCKSVQIQCRTGVNLLMATSQGAVNTSTPPGHYFTIKSSTVFKDTKLDIKDEVAFIYLAAGSAVVAEIVLTYDDSYNGGKEVA